MDVKKDSHETCEEITKRVRPEKEILQDEENEGTGDKLLHRVGSSKTSVQRDSLQKNRVGTNVVLLGENKSRNLTRNGLRESQDPRVTDTVPMDTNESEEMSTVQGLRDPCRTYKVEWLGGRLKSNRPTGNRLLNGREIDTFPLEYWVECLIK